MENPFATIEADLKAIKAQISHKPNPEWLDFDQACDYLGFSKSKLYKITMVDGIPLYRLGRMIRFKRDELDGWITGHRANLHVRGIQLER
jgi:excisionase family DNA binding protein